MTSSLEIKTGKAEFILQILTGHSPPEQGCASP